MQTEEFHFTENITNQDILVGIKWWLFQKKMIRFASFYFLGFALLSLVSSVSLGKDWTWFFLMVALFIIGLLLLGVVCLFQFFNIKRRCGNKPMSFSITDTGLKCNQYSRFPWKSLTMVGEDRQTFFLQLDHGSLMVVPFRNLPVTEKAKLRATFFQCIESSTSNRSKRVSLLVTSGVVTIAGLYLLFRILQSG